MSPPRPPEPPSREAYRALGPYARSRLTVHALGRSLLLDVPGDLFSTQRIDEGTQLLLGHLPPRPPASLLDLGCGYGALGLPVAARWPEARALLVDRDLLAVAASAVNAAALGLANVAAVPSLGYRGLPAGAAPFDWILCNVPARIGARAIGAFLAEGQRLLSPGGELRMVAIRDLVPVLLAEAERRGLQGLVRVVDGPRHTVFALAAPPPGSVRSDAPPENESIYERDTSLLPLPAGATGTAAAAAAATGSAPAPEPAPAPALPISRPQDASEDPAHARALALLFEALPSKAPKRVFAFRCGFGGAALAALARWPGVQVVAQERDLLDAAFLERNGRAHGWQHRLAVRATLWPAEAAGDVVANRKEAFDLVLGELSPSAPEGVALRELQEARALLRPGGHLLAVGPAKLGAVAGQARCVRLVERDGITVWRASPTAGR